jgi:plastocyanin
MGRDDTTGRAAMMFGLCAIAAATLIASCVSERATGSSASCDGTTVPCVINIRDYAFEPTTLRVRAGATVRWENGGGVAHTSTSDAGVTAAWDSGNIAPGGSYSRPFGTVGQFAYHCEPHPTMTATIIVE